MKRLTGILPMMTTAGTLVNGGGAEPGSPRVLLLGDSISMGYTEPARRALAGAAEVVHPPVNCQHTAFGLEHLDAWLGTGRWDVIHFNFGIHDSYRFEPEQYRANLERIVDRLARTGATLIWASSTPDLRPADARRDAIPAYNRIAAELMAARGIAINDLYAFVMPHAQAWQRPDHCHFTAQGNDHLGRRVADSIRRALQERAP